MKIDLSEFLPKKGSLDEFLPKKPEAPQDILGRPESLRLFWREEVCVCGRSYASQDHGPVIVHTMYRRNGFGLKALGRVMIPLVPNLDCSDLPVSVETKQVQIFACPSCIGTRPSLPLFQDISPAFVVSGSGECGSPHLMAWRSMHATAPIGAFEKTLQDIKRRDVDIDDLLLFRTTEADLRKVSADQVLCDPESNLETN